MTTIQIGSRTIGEGAPCYIIAEAGSNHNGSLEQAFRLIDVAVDAQADAVKFQLFTAATMYPDQVGASRYLGEARSIYNIIQDMEMPADWLPKLADHCATRGIEFIVSPFDEASADLIDPYVRAFKIASYEMTHAPLVRHVARFGKPIIMSTGTANTEEVRRAVGWIRETGNEQVVVLQCTAKYPAPLSAVNVRAVTTLRHELGGAIGLSDHSREPSVAACAAVALGAVVIEKHFTLSNYLPGPDHRFALEPADLVKLVADVRATEAALGHGRKEMLPEEEELHQFARRSVFAVHPIRRGDVFTRENIAVLRNGDLGAGMSPEQYDGILGRVAARDLLPSRPVVPDDVG